MTEFTIAMMDDRTGTLIVEDETELGQFAQRELANHLGQGETLGCARPREILKPAPSVLREPTIRISGIWHDSLVEGPGRRSVVRMQGCPIRCAGCWVPETHDETGGYLIDIDTLALNLLDPYYPRDGVTILGGEPFAQPIALARLVFELSMRGCQNILVYTGFTLESLHTRNNRHIEMVLETINMLVDGPYVQALSSSAGPWTGSGNQRVHTFSR